MLQNLVLKVAYLHYFMVLKQIVELLVDQGPNLVSAPLLTSELELLALAWAFFRAPTHLISTLA
jgi:hypothetical protein